MNKTIFIAEVKNKSPFGFYSKLALPELWELANQYGDWISVHTNYRWGGSFKWLKWCRDNTNKPILAKGIHSTDEEVDRALDLGADYVLVVNRIPESKNINKCLLEISDPKILAESLLEYPNVKYVYNSRDLKTGLEKENDLYDHYRYNCNWLCGASMIKNKYDPLIRYPLCDAFIIGENLPAFCRQLENK